MRILFFHLRRETLSSRTPHLGLASLSAVLRSMEHTVQVADYVLLGDLKKRGFRVPTPLEVLRDFRPDILGISAYTANFSSANHLIDVCARSGAPIIVGGPHATLHAEKLRQDSRITAIFRGESELSIREHIEKIRRTGDTEVINSPLPDASSLEAPDFTSFLGYEEIRQYPMMTSRGCPYKCIFCAVHSVASRKWRRRDPLHCVEELEEAKQRFPNLEIVEISDDCPLLLPRHFKRFLELYIEHKIDRPIIISNIRADKIDREFLRLAKRAGVTSLCLGVEHAHPEVFRMVDKGESLEDIERAASLIRQHGIALGCCFIIGLPGDTLERSKDCVAFAKRICASFIFWNMAHPMEHTGMYIWFKEHGTIAGDGDYSSYSRHTFRSQEPIAETREFTREERKKAYFYAVMMTDQYVLNLREIPQMFYDAMTYRLLGVACISIMRQSIRQITKAIKAATMIIARLLFGRERAKRLYNHARMVLVGPRV